MQTSQLKSPETVEHTIDPSYVAKLEQRIKVLEQQLQAISKYFLDDGK